MGEFGGAVCSRCPAVWHGSAFFRAPGLQGCSGVSGKARWWGDQPGGPAVLRDMRWAFRWRWGREVSLWRWRCRKGFVLFSGHAWRWLQREKRNLDYMEIKCRKSKNVLWSKTNDTLGEPVGLGAGETDEIETGRYGWNVQVWTHVISSGFPAFTHRGWVLETLLESSGSLWTMQRKKETLMMIYAIFRNVCKNKHHYYDAFCLYFSKQ